MSNVSATNTLDSMRWDRTDPALSGEDKSNQQLSQEDFFALLTTQLAAQDPTKPTDNDKMIEQMTNFTMADGITGLSKQFESFTSEFSGFMEATRAQQTSNKALQASSMVGREVLVPAEEGALFQYGDDVYGMRGQLQTDIAYNDLRMQIRNEKGSLIAEVEMGATNGKPFDFMWDGKDKEGNQLEAGVYQLSATGINANSGKREEITVATYSTVDSVRFGQGNELTMNLRGLGTFTMDDIIEVAP
ncbi:hypothetical protein HR060_00870 [Catenovulum sp. SM1970]|uniref:flagellar hook capping FlgD N-terminal domain-containing protein n=1 Tax=Marinifaba aquimaris TaxID=2741323 RepID=UPI001571AF6A|nr:flagellar hook capping FlgD N-terminal domain-containing protein [Marinifaba aquimaris]NTS75402.1 hypothetical protein [Marinifaba aquimaris]